MIGWVDQQLVQWGAWSQRRQDGGLGYPKQSPSCVMRAAGSSAGSVILSEPEALRIEAAMVMVKARRPELYAVGWQWYVVGAPVSTVAQRCGCHRNTVQARLSALHIAVANHIDDASVKRSA